MSGQAFTNTSPGELGRRLNASGPMGFITAVYQTLQRLNRPYYYTDSVPRFLLANEDSQSASFTEAYRSFYGEGEEPKSFVATPHAIVHQYRKYPAKTHGRSTQDSPNLTRRQKNPHGSEFHNRPLPTSPQGEPELETRHAFDYGSQKPLWDSIDQVPDIIREQVRQNPQMYVTKWNYDVFVDFVCLASTGYWVEQMATDLEFILQTLHHRFWKGASNLHGWHVATVTGAPSDLGDLLHEGISARTITWQLRQTQAYAMPAHVLDEIRVDVHGQSLDDQLP